MFFSLHHEELKTAHAAIGIGPLLVVLCELKLVLLSYVPCFVGWVKNV